jgi:hypothetical protein
MRSPKNILVRFLLITVVLILGCHRAAWGRIIYVDRNAKGAINGSSWTNACRNLEDALGKARSAEKPVEVRVAQGVWKPGWSGYSVEEKRHASFELYSGVTLKGGYAGVEGEDPDRH